MNRLYFTTILANCMNKSLYLIFIITCWGCLQDSNTEKHQEKRDNVVNVRKNVEEINIKELLIGSIAPLYMMGDYLIIGDVEASEKLIHIFDKNTFNYLGSTTYRGQGPNEITTMGHVAVDESRRIFYVSDHGKQKIFSFNVDSVLSNPLYAPAVKTEINEKLFPDKYLYVNDTLCYGLAVNLIGNSDFTPTVAKWNMNTGEIKLMEYIHPDIKKKRICFAASVDHKVYVECYAHYDLMTICDLDGNLKCNIYGSGWSEPIGDVRYYGNNVAFTKDKIVALFSGNKVHSKNAGKSVRNLPSGFLVFDINGNYVKTLETGLRITYFCYDKENNRLIMSLDDEIQFAYLNLDGIV